LAVKVLFWKLERCFMAYQNVAPGPLARWRFFGTVALRSLRSRGGRGRPPLHGHCRP